MFSKFVSLSIVFFTIWMNSNSTPNIVDYDLSEFYSNAKPLINYEKFFGDIINVRSLFQKVDKQNFYSFKYFYDSQNRVIQKDIKDIYSFTQMSKFYHYNTKNFISKITIVCENYNKTYEFIYNEKNMIKTIKESIDYDNSYDYSPKFDYFLYEFDKFGRICAVYGINTKIFGLFKSSKLLRMYDYYKNNKLKFIWNFENPNNTQLLQEKNIVTK